ncbi:MAG: PAS domain S-box protein [Syntrophaceae bacterium]|nr:PAS domain S-box protein [Syntrophaceae bacterium]
MNRIREKLKSIAPKVMIILTLGIVLIMSGAGIMNYQSEKARAIKRLQKTADQTTARISNSLIYPLWNISHDEIDKTIDLEMGDENVVAIVLFDEFHQYLVGKIEDQQGRVQDFDPVKDAGRLVIENLISRKKEIHKGSEYMGEVRLYFTDHFLIRELNELALKITLLTVLLSAFTFIIVFLTLHKFVLTPLTTLQNATQRLKATISGADSENFRVQIGSGDEIDMLGRDFNDMADELVASQAQLRHTADHIQALLDEIPDAVVDMNINGRITDINKTFCYMFSGDLDDFIGAPLVDLAASEDSKETIGEHLGRALQGQHVDFEWQVAKQTGESFFVLVRMRLIPSGKEHHLLAVITDVTERKQAVEALRESEAKYRRLIDNLGREYFFYVHDTEGIFTYASPSVHDMLGFTQEEFMTHYSTYLTDNPVNREAMGKTNLSLKGLRQQPYQVEIKDKSGCPFWLEVSESPVFDSTGKVVAIEGIAHDITARKLAQEALRESEERFRSLFEKSADAVLLNENDEFTACNQAAVNMLRATSKEQIMQRTPADLSPLYQPDGCLSTNKMEQLSAKVIAEGSHRFEWTHRRFNGEEFPTEVLLTLIPSGNRKLIHVVWRDITDRKAAEEALRSSEARLRAIGDNLPGGMVYQLIISPDGSRRFTYLSRGVERLHEVTAEEAMRDSSILYNQIAPEDRTKLMREEEISIAEMSPFSVEARTFNPSGAIRWCHIASQPRLQPNGDIIYDGVELDITERKHSEMQILESLGLLQATLESAADGILVTDLNAHIVNYNRRFMELWKIPPEVLDAGDDHAILKTVTTQLKEPEAFLEGLRFLYDHPDVEQHDVIRFLDGRFFERYSIPTYRGKETIGRVLSFRDVTETKRAEEALRSSEAKYRRLHESMTDAFVRVDLRGQIVEANKSFLEITGYNEEELSHLSYEDLTPAKWHAMEEEITREQVIARGYSDIYEKEYRRKDGHVSPIELRAFLIRDDEGQPIGRWAIVRDITKRKQTEEALRESEALFRSQFEFGNIGIAITSPDKGWLRVNKRLCEMLGFSEEELRQKTWIELTHPDDLATDLAQFDRMLAGEIETYELDKRFHRKNGSLVFTHLSVSCIRNPDGIAQFVIASLSDITARKTAENRLRESLGILQATLESTADGILATDRKQNIINYNHRFKEMWQIPSELLEAGKDLPVLSFVLNQLSEPEAFLEGVQYLFANPEIERYDLIPFKDGRIFERYSIPNYQGDEIVGRVWSFRDITERKLSEMKIQQYQENLEDLVNVRTRELSETNAALVRFRRFAETSGQGFGMATLDGRIVYANATLRHLIGEGESDTNEFVSYLELYPAEYRQKLEDEIIPLVLKDKQWIGELALVTSSGHIIPTIENYFLIRDEAGNPALIADVITDVRDMKRTEKELRKYRDHLEDLVKQRTKELQNLNEDLKNEILVRMNTEEALRESEQRYRTLFENAPVGISIMRPDLTFAYFNPRFTEMLGYALADLPDKNVWFKKAYPDPDYRRQVITFWKDDITKTRGRKRYGDRVLKARGKNGKDKVIHFRTAVLDNGEHLMTYEDVTELQELNDSLRLEITERVRMAEALRDSEMRYRTLFEGAPVGIGLATLDGKIINANEGLLQLFRLPSMEDASRLELKNIYLDPDERSRLLGKILREGSVHDYETKLRRIDNSTLDVIMTMSLFTYEGKETILSVIQDITWKKQAEEETRHLKNYLANIIDSMPSILVGVDKKSLVTQWNTAAEKQTGISAEKAKGQPVDKVLPLLSNNTTLISEAIKTNRTQSYPRLQAPAGDENRFLDVTVYPLVSNGVGGAVVRIDDITDRIRIEEMMIQTEKMLSVGGLAAGMAHEINNPLGIILAASQNVLRRVSPTLSANIGVAEDCGISLSAVHDYLAKRQILTFLDDIKNGVIRANQIVANMLSLSRRPDELGSLENMADLMEQTLLLAATDYDLKKKHDFRKIQIDKEYDPLTPLVSCQGSKIQQVFLNVLRNAAEAMEDSRTEANPPRLIIRIGPSEKWVRIEIEDNGPGMEETVRKRVFEPFFTTKAPGVGTGLGLSVSYFIITENHGGTISVESSPGTGARFIIQLSPAEESRI